MTDDLPDILTTAEVAQILDKSIATVIRLCNDDKLVHFRTPGGHRRIRLNALRDYILNGDNDDHYA